MLVSLIVLDLKHNFGTGFPEGSLAILCQEKSPNYTHSSSITLKLCSQQLGQEVHSLISYDVHWVAVKCPFIKMTDSQGMFLER